MQLATTATGISRALLWALTFSKMKRKAVEFKCLAKTCAPGSYNLISTVEVVSKMLSWPRITMDDILILNAYLVFLQPGIGLILTYLVSYFSFVLPQPIKWLILLSMWSSAWYDQRVLEDFNVLDKPILIPARPIPTFCHAAFASHPDIQGTLWCRQPTR